MLLGGKPPTLRSDRFVHNFLIVVLVWFFLVKNVAKEKDSITKKNKSLFHRVFFKC
jgi:large-conductance mechanosensitive channel